MRSKKGNKQMKSNLIYELDILSQAETNLEMQIIMIDFVET